MHLAVLSLLLAVSTCAAKRTDLYYNSSLPAPQQHFKFLFLLPTPVPSHTWAVAPLAVALAHRGHEVSMLCDDPNIFEFPNVTCIYHGVTITEQIPHKYGKDSNFVTEFTKILNSLDGIAEKMSSSAAFQKLYKSRKEFDLIVVEDFAMAVMYPLLNEMSYVLYSSLSLNAYQSAQLGNVQNPLYVAEGRSFDFPHSNSLMDRIKNLITNIFSYIFFGLLLHCATKTLETNVPDSRTLTELERNASVHFINTILALDGPMPLLPNQIPIGGIVLRPLADLPEEIADFLSGEKPVVYVSFGISVLTDDNIPPENKKILFSVFSKLRYKVIVKISKQKYKRTHNVLYVDSVPQQTILAHPNVRAFVSHCGLGGAVEAIQNAVPIVGLPALLDQHRTAFLLQKHGAAILLSWDTLDEKNLEDAIEEVIINPSYQRKMGHLSRIFRDQFVSPLDTAVYWTEYAARHQGAPHLQSPARGHSFIKLFGLDFIVSIFFGLLLIQWMWKWRSTTQFARRIDYNKNKCDNLQE